jgi:ribosomal protein S18 acetylase RimI-like enzyme
LSVIGVTIRRLSLSDEASVHALRLALDEPGPLGPPLNRAEALQPQQIALDLSALGRVAFGVFMPSGLIGASFIAPTPNPLLPNWLSLFGVAVRPGSRGNGLGRTLTEACISYATGCGAEGILLNVNVPNPAAERLYQSLGFEFWSTDGTYSDNGITYNILTMKKLIQPSGCWDAA